MSRFTRFIAIRQIDDSARVWVLTDDLPYEIGDKGSGHWIIVPAGFLTDGASTGFARVLLPPFSDWGRAAAIHDYLCRSISDGSPVGVRGWGVVSRRSQADAIFHEAMLVCGTPRWRAWLAWQIVRLATRFPALREASAV